MTGHRKATKATTRYGCARLSVKLSEDLVSDTRNGCDGQNGAAYRNDRMYVQADSRDRLPSLVQRVAALDPQDRIRSGPWTQGLLP